MKSLFTLFTLLTVCGFPAAEPAPAWSLALRWQPDFPSDDDRELVLCHVQDAEKKPIWSLRYVGQGTLRWESAATPRPPALEIEGLAFAANQPIQLAFTWSSRELYWHVNGRLAAQRLTSGFAGGRPHSLASLASPRQLGWSGTFLAGRSRPAQAAATEARVLVAPPSTRRHIHPAKYPPLATNEPGLLLHLDFDPWPVPHVSPDGPRTGIRQVTGIVGNGVSCRSGGLRCGLRRPLGNRGTFAVWVKPEWTLPGETDSHVLLHVPTSGPTTDNFHLQLWKGNISARAGSMAAAKQPGADPRPLKPIVWKPGAWRHLAMTWSPESARLYVDGALAGTDDKVSYPHRSEQEIHIGCWAGGSRPAKAVLDDVRVYDRNLSAADIMHLARRTAMQKDEP